MSKRGRRPTESKSRSERVVPRLSPRREAEAANRLAEDYARKLAGLPPLPQSERRHSETANAALARLCMRFLWEREHLWTMRGSLADDIAAWAADRGEPEATADRMERYMLKDGKVRVHRPGMALAPGEIVELYRPVISVPNTALFMAFVLKI